MNIEREIINKLLKEKEKIDKEILIRQETIAFYNKQKKFKDNK